MIPGILNVRHLGGLVWAQSSKFGGLGGIQNAACDDIHVHGYQENRGDRNNDESGVRLCFPSGPNKFFFGETLTNNGFGVDRGSIADGRGKTKCGIG